MLVFPPTQPLTRLDRLSSSLKKVASRDGSRSQAPLPCISIICKLSCTYLKIALT